jgi:hypothetical protein
VHEGTFTDALLKSIVRLAASEAILAISYEAGPRHIISVILGEIAIGAVH